MTEAELKAENSDLRREVEKLKTTVSGNDRIVSRHMTRIGELEAELADKPPADPDPPPADPEDPADPVVPPKPDTADLDARREALDRRERALALALDRGLEPAAVYTMLGLDDLDDEARVDAMAERDEAQKAELKKANRRANGRERPHQSIKLSMEPQSYEDLARMSPDRLAALPDSTWAQAKQIESAKTTETRRQGHLRALFGKGGAK